MKRLNAILFSLLTLVAFGCGKQAPPVPTPISNPAAEKAAIESAQAWLQLVDEGNYAKSWEEAAAPFKSAITQADWEKLVQGARAPLGKLGARRIKSQHYTREVPGAPDGEYVVIEFAATFEHKANGVETITPMLDKDGRWRVSGYYVR